MAANPVRTCVGCRSTRAQSELLRLARGPEGAVVVDAALPAGRRNPGRGAYLCPNRQCLVRAVKSGGLTRALRLRGPLPEDVVAALDRVVAGQ